MIEAPKVLRPNRPFEVIFAKEPLTPPIDVVRAFCLSKISPNELSLHLQSGKPIDTISFYEGIMMVKNEMSSASAGQLTPVGGKLRPRENPIAGALRELREEAPFLPTNFYAAEELGDDIDDDTSFLYTPPGTNPKTGLPYQPRRTYMTIVEVNRFDGRKPFAINVEKDKADGFILVPAKMLTEHIRNPDNNRAIGSAVMGRQSDIEIDDDNLKKKDEILESLCREIDRRETVIRQRILMRLNTIKPVPFNDLSRATHQEIIDTYQQIVEEDVFRSYRTLEVRKLRGADADESEKKIPKTDPYVVDWLNVFDQHPALETGKKNEKSNEFERLHGVDLLLVAHVYASLDSGDFSTLINSTTHSVANAVNFLRYVTIESLAETMAEKPSLLHVLDIHPLDMPRINEKLSPKKKRHYLHEVGRLMKDPIKALYQNHDVIVEQYDFEKALSHHIEQKFAERFGLTPSEVRGRKKMINNMLSRMVDSASLGIGGDTRFHQFHRLINEVQNASSGRLLLLAAGITPYEDQNLDPVIKQMYKFEAARTLALWIHAQAVYPFYKQIETSGSEIIERLVETTFGPITHAETQDLSRPEEPFSVPHLQFHRGKTGTYPEAIVDQKDQKPEDSYLRRSYEGPEEEIYDIYSFNICVPDETDGDEIDLNDAREAIYKMRELVRMFVENLHDGLESRFKIGYFNARDYTRPFLRYLSAPPQEHDRIRLEIGSGKRAGSQGNRIPRVKFGVQLIDRETGDEHRCELVFLPAYQLSDKTNGVFMGLYDKLNDQGRYNLERITLPLTFDEQRFVGYPSAYELLYPWHIYEQALTVMEHRGQQPKH